MQIYYKIICLYNTENIDFKKLSVIIQNMTISIEFFMSINKIGNESQSGYIIHSTRKFLKNSLFEI